MGGIWVLFRQLIFLISYISSVNSFPKPLGREEERECLTRFKSGDMDARNTLIEHNLRLVAHIAKKYSASGLENEDLISIGTIGLMKGVESFNADKGSKLSTYVSRCIENAIWFYVARITPFDCLVEKMAAVRAF